jgi:predicted ribosome quality control (RQC) complex YloA/Tae2 family protein
MAQNYQHYLRLVKILERLRRESDLELAPKLIDRLLDAQAKGEITAEQALELSERVQRWRERLEEYIFSQEHQMRKLLRQMEAEDRRRTK